MSIKKLDLPLLEECFLLDYQTGTLIWKVRPISHFINSAVAGAWNTQNANTVASSANNLGYKVVSVMASSLKQHRILYGLFHNDDNPPCIDHFDGNASNNSISNLRPISGSLNNKNTSKKKNNSSGITGVSLTPFSNWVVRIDSETKRISRTFKDFFEACCFRKSMEIQLEYSKRHGN